MKVRGGVDVVSMVHLLSTVKRQFAMLLICLKRKKYQTNDQSAIKKAILILLVLY